MDVAVQTMGVIILMTNFERQLNNHQMQSLTSRVQSRGRIPILPDSTYNHSYNGWSLTAVRYKVCQLNFVEMIEIILFFIHMVLKFANEAMNFGDISPKIYLVFSHASTASMPSENPGRKCTTRLLCISHCASPMDRFIHVVSIIF
jgi:hypothetical protein